MKSLHSWYHRTPTSCKRAGHTNSLHVLHATPQESDGPRRTALVTGGTSGIGFETAKALAAQGYWTVIGARDVKGKGAAAKERILEEVPGAKVEVLPLDLSDLEQVRTVASRALEIGAPLDVLVANAGVMACPSMQTTQGFEYQLGVNHLGHYLLTRMLLPLLQGPDRQSRIVVVSSSAHLMGKVNFDDINLRQSYGPWKAYSQSKLANVLFAYELARRLPPNCNVTANALHPGIVATELQRHIISPNPPVWQVPLLQLARLFVKSPAQGARTSIFLASSPEVQGITAKYWADCKPQASSKLSYDQEAAARLWDLSAEMTGLPAELPTMEVKQPQAAHQ